MRETEIEKYQKMTDSLHKEVEISKDSPQESYLRWFEQFYGMQVIKYSESDINDPSFAYFILRGLYMKLKKHPDNPSEIKLIAENVEPLEQQQDLFGADKIIKILKRYHESIRDKENLLEVAVRINSFYLNLLDLG